MHLCIFRGASAARGAGFAIFSVTMQNQDLDRQRVAFALCWEILWPALGATFGGIMGAVVGGLAGGLLTAALFGLLGAALGLEAGHLFGSLVRLIFLPWIELFAQDNSTPALAGSLGAALTASSAAVMGAKAGWVCFLAGTAFVCVSWTVRVIQRASHERTANAD